MDMELGDDEELDPTDAELEAEAEAEPGMMRDAGYWDDFLNLVDIMQEPWAAPEADTNEYRQMRAVRVFNAGVLVYTSIGLDLLHSLQLRLHSALQRGEYVRTSTTCLGQSRSWVEHILIFVVVPRQIVEMGDPSRRSCDACESLGARFKIASKRSSIKHLTCRRVIHANKDVVSKRRKVYI